MTGRPVVEEAVSMVEKERTERVDGRSTRWVAHREKRRALLLGKARDGIVSRINRVVRKSD